MSDGINDIPRTIRELNPLQPKGAAQTAEEWPRNAANEIAQELSSGLWSKTGVRRRMAQIMERHAARREQAPLSELQAKYDRLSEDFQSWLMRYETGELESREQAAPTPTLLQSIYDLCKGMRDVMCCDEICKLIEAEWERGASVEPSPAATPLIDELNRVKWMLSPHERENVNALLDDFLGLERVAESLVPSEAAPPVCPTCGSDKQDMRWCSNRLHPKTPHSLIRFECVRCSDSWHGLQPIKFALSEDAEKFYALPDCSYCGGSGKVRTKAAQPSEAVSLLNALLITQRTVSGKWADGYTILVTGHEMDTIRSAIKSAQREAVSSTVAPPISEKELEHCRKVAASLPITPHSRMYPEEAFALYDKLLTLLYNEGRAWRVQVELADKTKAIISVNNRVADGEFARVQIRGIALELLGHWLIRNASTAAPMIDKQKQSAECGKGIDQTAAPEEKK
jgi:hypothetical protein